jgi:hypothetical protein
MPRLPLKSFISESRNCDGLATPLKAGHSRRNLRRKHSHNRQPPRQKRERNNHAMLARPRPLPVLNGNVQKQLQQDRETKNGLGGPVGRRKVHGRRRRVPGRLRLVGMTSQAGKQAEGKSRLVRRLSKVPARSLKRLPARRGAVDVVGGVELEVEAAGQQAPVPIRGAGAAAANDPALKESRVDLGAYGSQVARATARNPCQH